MWYIYTVGYYSATKKQDNDICSRTHGPKAAILNEGRQENISYDVTYIWNLKKNGTNELIYKTEIESQM